MRYTVQYSETPQHGAGTPNEAVRSVPADPPKESEVPEHSESTLLELKEAAQRFATEQGTKVEIRCYGGDLDIHFEAEPLGFKPDLNIHHTDVGR